MKIKHPVTLLDSCCSQVGKQEWRQTHFLIPKAKSNLWALLLSVHGSGCLFLQDALWLCCPPHTTLAATSCSVLMRAPWWHILHIMDLSYSSASEWLWVFIPPQGLALYLTPSSRAGRLSSAEKRTVHTLCLALPTQHSAQPCNKWILHWKFILIHFYLMGVWVWKEYVPPVKFNLSLCIDFPNTTS